MEIVLNDLECGSNSNDDADERTDDPFRGPADEPADDPDDERADVDGVVTSTVGNAGVIGDVEQADEEKCPAGSPTRSTVDSERDDSEGTSSNDESARPSASRDEKSKFRYCKAAAMVLVVWGIAITLIFITLGLGLDWWNGRLYSSDEDLCTLCGEDGLDLLAIDGATPFPTRQPSEPDPVHIFSYSHRERSLDGAVG